MAEPMNPWREAQAPDLDDFLALAEAALAALPAAVRAALGEVSFHITEFADEATLESLEIDDPFGLTGLYEGVDAAHRSVLDGARSLSRVSLYRRPILDEWAERGDVTLGALIAHVLVHEIGHHLGLSDARMAAIEDSAR